MTYHEHLKSLYGAEKIETPEGGYNWPREARKREEKRLKESEAKLKLISDKAPEARQHLEELIDKQRDVIKQLKNLEKLYNQRKGPDEN